VIQNIVQSSSAWAGLAGGSPVDEVEAVRIISGEPPGVITSLKSKCTNPVGNDRTKTLAVIEKHCAFFFEVADKTQLRQRARSPLAAGEAEPSPLL